MKAGLEMTAPSNPVVIALVTALATLKLSTAFAKKDGRDVFATLQPALAGLSTSVPEMESVSLVDARVILVSVAMTVEGHARVHLIGLGVCDAPTMANVVQMVSVSVVPVGLAQTVTQRHARLNATATDCVATVHASVKPDGQANYAMRVTWNQTRSELPATAQ